jgi:hypothetical protein
MKTAVRYALAFTFTLGLCTFVAGNTSCGVSTSSTTACVATPFISPTSVTLDHTTSSSEQQFNTGTKYSGSCAIPAIAIAYTWNVSDTSNASITSDGIASCKNASMTPITVYTTVATISGTPPVTTYISSGLPSATLTCK